MHQGVVQIVRQLLRYYIREHFKVSIYPSKYT